jgi:hypothetical protein
MANQYLDTGYVDAYLGTSVRAALFTDSSSGVYSSTNFNTVAKGASAIIETALRKSGYTPPTATVGTVSSVDEFIKLATYGAFIELAYNRPEHRLKLPENWDSSNPKLAYEAILNGDADVDLPVNTETAISGIAFSEQSEDITSEDGSRSHTFSRKNMAGY